MKNMIKFNSCVLFIIVFAVVNALAQALPDVQNSFNQYNLNAPQEKIYVHTDKNAYAAGELIWFKIYDVNANNCLPIDLSKVAYAELLDNDQNVVLQAKILLQNGKGSGSLYIPATAISGNFTLRAYTNWMKNFSVDYYFSKSLAIVNPPKTLETSAKASITDYDIQFFPEGGHLVNGINSIVAFKATDQTGKGIYFKGAVVNDKNDTIARFEPLKFGLGHFLFKPDNHFSYKAIVMIAGKKIQKDLPQINDSGYVLNLKDLDKDRLIVTVNSNLPDEDIYLFTHTGNVINNAQVTTANNGSAKFIIDKSKLADGVAHFTIFNTKRQPLCERLYFKRPVKKIMIDAKTDKQGYDKRKKVDITLNAVNQDNKSVIADMSMSVFLADSLQELPTEDIQSYLWLRADLKGGIESPAYYFKNIDTRADEAVDNLMLTQGWSRFTWDKILTDSIPLFKFLPEFNGPIITAKVTEKATNNPAKNILAYLSIPGKNVNMYASKSNEQGILFFNMNQFYGTNEIVVQTNTQIDTAYHIEVLSAFSEQYAATTPYNSVYNPTFKKRLEYRSYNTLVQNIYNETAMDRFGGNYATDSVAFYGQPSKTYLLDNYTRFPTVEEVMREYVREVNIVHDKDDFHIKVLSENGFLHTGDPMVLIDGVPFFNINTLFAINPLKLRKLELVRHTFYWGPSVEDGIFSFTSYKNDFGGAEIDPHAIVLDYRGLEMQREFYAPVYDSEKLYKSRLPDFRNVLYWNPNLKTDRNGKTNLAFYTSDQTGKYMGILEGITTNGEAGSQTFTFDVK